MVQRRAEPGQADARAGRREIIEDLRAPEFQAPADAPGAPAPIFEVDDEWFADGNKARAAKLDEQRQLAAEMGIHEVDLPKAEARLTARSRLRPQDSLSAPDAPVMAGTPVEPSEPLAQAPPIEPVHALEPVIGTEPVRVSCGDG